MTLTTRWRRRGPSVPPEQRVYTSPCARQVVDGMRGGTDMPTLLTADCGWHTRVPLGAEHHLTDALERWLHHQCLSDAGAG